MNLNSLDLNLLVALDALLLEANVSRAAMRIGLSQPAASHALQRLREVLGDPLLVRVGARMELTPRAQALRGPLAQALDQVRGLFIPDDFDAASSERRFRLMMPDLAVELLVPPLMKKVARLAPNVRLDVVLQLGEVTEEVTVTSAPPLVNTVAADLGNTVSGSQINDLPLTNRLWTQLILLEPGVVGSDPKQPGFGSNSIASYHLNGLRSDFNNPQIDGVRNLDTFGGNAFVTPNLHAVSEFRIENNSYDAATGRSAGGQINLISRSGTNEFHGNAFEYFRNDVLNARNLFAQSRPKNRYNDFGYDIGGPIKKDKLFFFWSEEWRRIIQSSGTRTTIVPTAAQRVGDFSALLQGPDSRIIRDPDTGVPFPNNVVPASKIDPNAKILLDTFYPLPTPGFNEGGLNFTASDPDTTRWREETIRLDYRIADNVNFFARFTQDNVLLLNPFELFNRNVLPDVAGSIQVFPIYNWAAHATFTLNPSFISEFRWGSYYGNDKRLEHTNGFRSQASGLNIPELFPGNNQDRIPSLLFSQGYAPVVLPWPFHNAAFTQPFESTNTWLRGRHTIRFGVELSLEGKNEYISGTGGGDLTNGQFFFSGQYTGDAMADFLVGRAFRYDELDKAIIGKYRWYNLESFGQDQIKLRPNLTLTLGMRYSYFQPEWEKSNLINVFLPSAYDHSKAPVVNPDGTIPPGTENFTNGLVRAGEGSPYGKQVFNNNLNNWGPRIGLAWDPTSTGKMAIRAGYAIIYNREGSWAEFSTSNPPFEQAAAVFNTLLSNPAGTAVSTSPIFPVSLASSNGPWRIPQVQKWSGGIEREIWGAKFEASYVGTKGTHLLGMTDINQPFPNALVAQGSLSADAIRPFPGFSSIAIRTTDRNSSYHSGQFSVIRPLQHGLAFQASYTISKTLTDSNSAWGGPQNSRDLRAEKGLASFDSSQVLTFNYLWEVPFFDKKTGAAKAVLDGWQISGITNFQKGFPTTVYVPFDNAGVGSCCPRANLIGNPSGPKTLTEWFNTAAFAVPPLTAFGNAGNGIIRGPGTNYWDFAVYKKLYQRESFHAQWRAQFFNIFNHPQFQGISNSIGSSTFGQVVSAGDPRLIQFGIELAF